MPIVRGDKIGESQRLNRCSVETSEFYGSMLYHKVPDDFGRFRAVPHLVWARMYPRREPTKADLHRMRRLMDVLGKAGLWRTWEVDGVTFAEMWKWTPTGNLYHRTPEPPPKPGWPVHVHTKRCATTGAARANDWGDGAGLADCLSVLNKVEGTGPEQGSNRTRAGIERGVAKGIEHPSHPSHPSPRTTNTPPTPPASAGGEFELPPTLAKNGNGHDRLSKKALAERVDAAWRYALHVGFHPTKRDKRELRSWVVHAGYDLARIQQELDRRKAEGLAIAPLPRRL